jgi:hypothetical protein
MCDNFPVASVYGSLENAEIAKSWKGVCGWNVRLFRNRWNLIVVIHA